MDSNNKKKRKAKFLIIVISALIVLGIGTTIVLCSGFLKTDDTDYEMAEQGFSDYFDIKSHVAEITSTFKNSNGYIEKEDVSKTISTVGDYAKNLYEAKKIKDYEITDDKSVWIQFNSGVEYIYIPAVEGMDSSTITTYQPCLAVYDAELQSLGSNSVDGSAQRITEEIDDYVFENNYDNDSISLDVLKKIGDNQVVIWHGHGGYSTKTHSILQTGLKLDEEKFLLDPIYYIKQIGYTNDYLTGRIICSDSGYVVVTYKFFEKYLTSVNSSIVYLGACESGKDDVLVNTFIKKGAKAVIGNTEEIPTRYNLQMISSVFNGLLLTKDNKYQNIQVALENAKTDNSALYRETGCIADVNIWGENSIRLSEKDVSSNATTATEKATQKPTEKPTEKTTEAPTEAQLEEWQRLYVDLINGSEQYSDFALIQVTGGNIPNLLYIDNSTNSRKFALIFEDYDPSAPLQLQVTDIGECGLYPSDDVFLYQEQKLSFCYSAYTNKSAKERVYQIGGKPVILFDGSYVDGFDFQVNGTAVEQPTYQTMLKRAFDFDTAKRVSEYKGKDEIIKEIMNY